MSEQREEAGSDTQVAAARGLGGDALKEALEHDAIRQKLEAAGPEVQQAVKEALAKPWSLPVINTRADPTSTKLPEGVSHAMWIPVAQGDGTTFFTCTVDGFGHIGQGTSRSKAKALAYALQDLADAVLRAEGAER